MNTTFKTYWDKEWEKRDVGDDEIMCNTAKADYLLKLIWNRVEYIPLKKLEIGCGFAFHVRILTGWCRDWGETYMGIDSSRRAIKKAQSWGINAQHGDIYTFESDKKFELFMFMDVLEHLEDHRKVGAQIQKLAAPNYHIFANVPLYRSEHEKEGGLERHMDISVVATFMKAAGIPKFTYEIYGIHGYPYMWFRGEKKA